MSLLKGDERNLVKHNQGDFLNMSLLDITLNRIDRNTYDRNTIIASNLSLDTTERIISPTSATVGLEISFPSSAVNLSIASTSANDTSAGTGAQTIIVRGLDANYKEQDEELSMNGQTAVNTTNTFIRINDIFVKDAGSNGFNEGNIYVSDSADTFTAGVPQNRLYNAMEIGDNISKTAVFTSPRNFKFLPILLNIQTTTPNTNPLTVNFYYNNLERDGNTFIIRERFYLRGGSTNIDLSNNRAFDPQGDFYITAYTETNTSESIHLTLTSILQRE